MNVARLAVVGRRQRVDGIVRVKNMGGTERAQRADGTTQVHVIASNHQSTAPRAEPQQSRTICLVQAITGIDRKQPHLVVVAAVE